MSLRAVNLNLVPVLHALLREQSVSRAAAVEGLSQPAASDALRRLRLALNDPLLVRVGGRMILTPFAVELIPPVEALYRELEALFERRAFDPVSSDRTFVVAAVDSILTDLGPALLQRLSTEAPAIRVRFLEAETDFKANVAERRVDLALVPEFAVADTGPPFLRFKALTGDKLVAVFRVDHPLSKKDLLDEEDFHSYRQLLLDPVLAPRHPLKRQIENLAPVAAYVSSLTALPHLVLGSDHFGIITDGFGRSLEAALPLTCRPLRFLPHVSHSGMAWSPVNDADAGHRWFRETLTSIAKQLPRPTDGGPARNA